MKYKHALFALLTLTTCLFLSRTYADNADAYDDDSDGSDKGKIQVYHLSADMDLVTKTSFQYGKHRMVIKLVYPEIQTNMADEGVDGFDQAVVDAVQQQANYFKKQVANNADAMKMLPKEASRNNLYVDYSTSAIKVDDNFLFSVRFNAQGYIACMAHPYHVHQVLNYDLNNHEQIELADLFLPNTNYLQTLSNYTSVELFKHLTSKDMIPNGTAPTADNFKNWNIKPDGILITFDEAQVAPYVYGSQKVLVPYSAIKSILNPDSVIASCIKHRSKCRQANLFTGGFLDEAINVRHRPFHPTLSGA